MAFDAQALRGFIETGNQNFTENTVSYIFRCPHCGKPKLYIRKSDGVFRCWVCAETQNFKGSAEYALVALYGGSIQDYRKVLRGEDAPLDRLQLLFADHWNEEDEAPIEIEPELVDWEWSPLTLGPDEEGFEPGRQYLASRGISETIIRKYGIRYSGWENRILFPFVVGGKLVGWQGRLCGPSEVYDAASGRTRRIPKALTTIQDGVQGRHFMFGDGLLGSEHVILCEGPIDALKADLCGGNVAALGKGVTERQMRSLAARVKKIFMALDPDAAEEMTRLMCATAADVQFHLLPPPDGCKDLGEASPEAVLEAFHEAERRPFFRNQSLLFLGGKLCY